MLIEGRDRVSWDKELEKQGIGTEQARVLWVKEGKGADLWGNGGSLGT